MVRLGPATYRNGWSLSAGLLGLSLCVSACGGGSTPVTAVGAEAILNGATLATATSHWVAAKCEVQAELTSDHGFLSVVTDTSGGTTVGTETWAAGSSANNVTVGPGLGGQQGIFWITALSGISGSGSAGTFTANVTVETGSTPQNLGSCVFTLTQKGLSVPAASPEAP